MLYVVNRTLNVDLHEVNVDRPVLKKFVDLSSVRQARIQTESSRICSSASTWFCSDRSDVVRVRLESLFMSSSSLLLLLLL